jgi:hypothetical protein
MSTFVSKLEIHIVSKVVTHKISFNLNSSKNQIWFIWALKVRQVIETMNMQLICLI